MSRWRWRGSVAMLAICVGFVIYPLIESNGDVINSDWPAFATGARIIVSNPGHLYDLSVQRGVERDVTGGRVLVSLGIKGILPFLAPAWAGLVAVPFELLGTDLGGRLWIIFGLACLAAGLLLAVRPRAPSAILPAFASVPTALLLLNAQLDGLVALGVGAAVALWSRPYLAGLALGLTLMKPHLVVTLGIALILARRWRVLAGWAAAGTILWASAAVLNPRWVLEWLGAVGTTVQPGGREVDLAHVGVFLPAGLRTPAEILVSAAGTIAVLLLARRRREDFQAVATVLVAGSVVAALHALPTDLVMVAVALAIWGRAQWYDWLLLSVGAAVCALSPDPVPVLVGLLVIGWVCLRAAGLVVGPRGSARQDAASA
ncbi:MAG TPA: glycosyltransferase 87 family protein [Candidatus Dormibacteraeota bacterium]|nr:glycosyltransferase 87 family protein [Candidatus Dormibacteraeota bacterium]